MRPVAMCGLFRGARGSWVSLRGEVGLQVEVEFEAGRPPVTRDIATRCLDRQTCIRHNEHEVQACLHSGCYRAFYRESVLAGPTDVLRTQNKVHF